jgi:hypothetical protein
MRDRNDLLSRLVSMQETWLYHYDPETQQHSTEWRNTDSPLTAPYIPSAEIRW